MHTKHFKYYFFLFLCFLPFNSTSAGSRNKSFSSEFTTANFISVPWTNWCSVTPQLGDFNGDGKTDLLCDIPSTGTVSVAFSNGDGTFNPVNWGSGWCVGYNSSIGDFNGDGKADLLCDNPTSGNIWVALSNGNGSFTSNFRGSGWCVGYNSSIGDFNGDGKADLLCDNPPTGSVWVALSNGNGSFTSNFWGSGWCTNYNSSIGDFNGDGKADLLCDYPPTGSVWVALSNGDGSFTSNFWGSGWCTNYNSSIGDFNGDGKADLLCDYPPTGSVWVALSNGDGSFTSNFWGSGWCVGYSSSIVDFDNNARSDLACHIPSGYSWAALSNGDGTFLTRSMLSINTAPYSASFQVWCANGTFLTGDFNGDGKTDLLCDDASAISVGLVNGANPIQHKQIFQQEQELFGYSPAFTPNATNSSSPLPSSFTPDIVTFDLGNRPYMRIPKRSQTATCRGDLFDQSWVETMDANGNWTRVDIAAQARVQLPPSGDPRVVNSQWDGCFQSGGTNEDRIVFDSQGNAYTYLDAEVDDTAYQSILLCSKDRGLTWKAYWLHSVSLGMEAKLEFNDGNNPISGPPVLLVMNGSTLSIIVPTMDSNGNLIIPPSTQLVNDSLLLMQHSGASNSSVTVGSKTFIVYPSSNPAQNCVGTGVFASTFDHVQNTISSSVYVGCSGQYDTGVMGPDSHDIPAIAMDSQGYFHVILGAHQGQFYYTKSLVPYDTSAWSTPILIGQARGQSGGGGYTYVSLICDKQNALHVVARWAGSLGGQDDYFFRLVYMRKPAGQPWQTFSNGNVSDWYSRQILGSTTGVNHLHLVVASEPNYAVYHHKLNVDRLGRLFLNYETFRGQMPSDDSQSQSSDDSPQYCAKWPNDHYVISCTTNYVASCDNNGLLIPDVIPQPNACPTPQDPLNCGGGDCFYLTAGKPHDPSLLMSSDGGSTWHLVTSRDFYLGIMN